MQPWKGIICLAYAALFAACTPGRAWEHQGPKKFDAGTFVKNLKLQDEPSQKLLPIMEEYGEKLSTLESQGRPPQPFGDEKTDVSSESSGERPSMEDMKAKMEEVKAKKKELRSDVQVKVAKVLDKKGLKKWNKAMDKLEKEREPKVGGNGPGNGPPGGPGGGGPGGGF